MLACVARISVWFQSIKNEEQESIPFLGLSLFQNQTEILAMQATRVWELMKWLPKGSCLDLFNYYSPNLYNYFYEKKKGMIVDTGATGSVHFRDYLEIMGHVSQIKWCGKASIFLRS